MTTTVLSAVVLLVTALGLLAWAYRLLRTARATSLLSTVAVVHAIERDDGIYLFADMRDAEAFAEVVESDTLVDATPLISRFDAPAMIEAERESWL